MRPFRTCLSRHLTLPFRLALLLALCLGALPALARPAGATAFAVTVTTTADTAHACATTGAGTCSLRDAVRFANTKASADTVAIAVPAGLYTLAGAAGEDGALGGDLDLKANVTLVGAGQAATILDGNGADRVIQVFAGFGVTLSSLTIRHGSAPLGGGILDEGTLTLTDCAVTDNAAGGASVSGQGGGIAVTSAGKLTLVYSLVGNNAAKGVGSGGGIYHDGSGALTLTGSTVKGNATSAGSAIGFGGGIYLGSGAPATLTDTTISDNTVAGVGGGIYHNGSGSGGALILTGSTVAGNIATPPSGGFGGSGGGVFHAFGTLTLSASTVRDNQALAAAIPGGLGGRGGGLFHVASAPLTVVGGLFSGNAVTGAPGDHGLGGAIYNDGKGANTIVNSTFSANKAEDLAAAGAIYNTKDAALTLTNVTLNANSGALTMQAGGSGSLTVRNTIVADSTSGVNCAGAITNGGYNLDSGASCGFGAASGSASVTNQPLGPLTAAAPGTPAFHPITGPGAAVDRAPASGAGCPAQDQRGVARPQGAACDSGAYEFVPPVVSYPVTIATTGDGAASPGSGTYAGVITLVATPAAGSVFTGWTIDGQFRGWASPATLTVDAPHTIVAAFAPRPAFADVTGAGARAEAIGQLAARGIVKGYGDGLFGPLDGTLRAQMAALIARATGWDAQDWGNPFGDQGATDADLWRNVGTLAHYGVAKGYADGSFDPTGPVLHAQVISFVTRALVAQGLWAQQPDDPALYPNIPAASGHRADLATFVHYAGAVPGTDPAATWDGWAEPATRGWFALVEWQALNAYWGVDRIP